MNTLKSYIFESLLDIDNIDSSDVLVEEFLKENYKIYGSYDIKDGMVDVKGNVEVVNKKITQLTNGLFRFGIVKGNFSCSSCKSLVSLKGAPVEVSSCFYCNDCKSLKSLEGAPKEVGGSFYCTFCNSLVSLKGAPREVGKEFDCSYCKSLVSLKGAPKEVGGSFYCNNCGKKFIREEVESICKVKRNIYL